MEVIVNGQPRLIREHASVAELIQELGLGHAACAVEVNKRLVPKAKHVTHTLASGDSVEIVTLVGGG